MATLANLAVEITGNTVGLRNSLDKAQTRVGKFKGFATKALKAVRTAATGLAIGGAAAITGFAVNSVKDFIQTGEELDKMSKRTGISVEALSELKFAAEQSGSSLETIEKGSKKLASSIFDAQNGVKASADAFEALGLNIMELQALSPEEQFTATADALGAVADATTKSALAADIFGKAGTELIPLFSEGAEGMAALRQQAIDLGNTFSGDAAAQAAKFNDTVNELKQTIGGFGKDIAEKIVPILTNLLDWFIDARPGIEKFLTQVKEKAGPFVEAFVSGAGFIIEALGKVLGWIVSNKPVLLVLIGAIGVGIVAALGPVSLAVLAILGIITVIGLVRDNWETIWGKVLSIWETITGAIKRAYESNLGWLLPGGAFVKAILFVRDNWDTIWKAVFATFDFLSSAISGVWLTSWGWLQTGFSIAVELIQNTWERVWGGILTSSSRSLET